jgi:TolB-like protein
MRSLLLLGIAAWLLAGPALAGGGGKVDVAIMEFASDGGVSEKQMVSLEDLLATEIRKAGDFRVIGKSDIMKMLRLEERKNLMGCSDDSCIAEIGGALGVRWVVFGNVGQFGSTFLLNIKLMDAEKIHVVGSSSRSVKGGLDRLVEVLPQMVRELFGNADLKEKLTGGPVPHDPVAGRVTGEHPYRLWGHVGLWSGVGLAAFGGLALWQAVEAGDDYNHTGDTADGDRSRAWSGAMWAGFGLGAALIAMGAILWILEPEGSGSAGLTGASAAPTPDGRGAILSVGGRF